MSDRTIWDDKAHLDLLMAVLNNATLTSKEWDKILADLRVKGYNYTSSAAIPPLPHTISHLPFCTSHLILQLPTETSNPPSPASNFQASTITIQRSIDLSVASSFWVTCNGSATTPNLTAPLLPIVTMETPTKGTGFKWDAAAERDLFAACLVAAGEPKGPTLKNAMAILNDHFGERFTQKAATHRFQHLQKLKRKDNASGNGNGEAATPKKARTTPKKRGKAADEDADSETPKTKKRRGPNKKAAAADDEDVDEEKGSFVKDEDDARLPLSQHIYGFDNFDILNVATFGS
ncbi:hypothetical protein VM1G_09269 [Cytospora mali]|uniref:Uncharacterized protein n=1 Tax=Cytospora mali TaxID=578113 RepID=A0A194WC77_CYTMA|nr:hypothetical protein VM1G_09269 [Valsa mali]